MAPKLATAATVLLLATSSALAAKKHTKKIDTTEVLHKGPANYACPPGYNLHGKKCSRVLESPKIPFCSIGELENGRCVDFRPVDQMCPAGFAQSGKGCARENTAPRVPICPTGYQLGGSKGVGYATTGVESYGKKKGGAGIAAPGECTRKVTVPLTYFCPEGFTNSGHQCIATKALEPMYYCDLPGYTLVGDRCTSTTHYDCSPNAPAPIVSQEVGLIGKTMKHLRALAKKTKHHGIATPAYSKQAPPQQEHYVVSQQCKKFEDLPALKKCPPNSVPDGKACVVTKVADKLPQCPAMGSLEYCYTIEGAQANYVCPSGFEDTSAYTDALGKKKSYGNGACVNREMAALKVFCAQGFQQLGDRCAAYRPAEYYCEGRQGGKKHGGEGKHGHGKSNGGALDCTYLDYAEPIVTYQVKYACTGKDCHPDAQTNKAHGHGHH